MKFQRVEAGHYRTSGGIHIREMSGKPPWCWNATNRQGKLIASDGSLRLVQRKLKILLEGVPLPERGSDWILVHADGSREKFYVADTGAGSIRCANEKDRWQWTDWAELVLEGSVLPDEDAEGDFSSDAGKPGCCMACELTAKAQELLAQAKSMKHVCGKG